MSQAKLIFMGTPDFACPALAALIDAGYEMAAVYSQPPRRAGRGQTTRRGPVHRLAEEAGIPVRTPASFKTPLDRRLFADLGADLAVVAAYGLILPADMLAAPRLGCLNIHASLLPKWRGAAPIQRAIMNGDEKTGVCLMAMDEGLDTGPVYACRETPITGETTAGDLHDRLATLGAELLIETLPAILAGDLTAQVQEGESGYAMKIDRRETEIDWELPADWIDRQVRGLSPFPGAWTRLGRERLKILGGRPEPMSHGKAPGTLLDDRLLVACGRDALRVTVLQRGGKGAMDADAFLRGYPLGAGSEFG